ncbi:MAG: lipid-A-disaccharide synthase [Deltaproteobacteria bacterium]|nr:MAG: lipid-A-disaccharide synthase [Deltaproteobacteria bacterium]
MAPPHILIVTGEASGDMHGAALVRAMRDQRPELTFSGMGGTALANAGVTILYDAGKLAVVGVTEVLAHLGDILRARRVLLQKMNDPRERPSLLILIDYPDFNLLLAKKAKQLGIPVFYYISPQVWAWRRSRVHTIGRLADRIGVILPFEQQFYARHGYTVDFVGHPLMDTVPSQLSKASFRAQHGIEPKQQVIGLLPGSRRKEVCSLLPDFLAAAQLLEQRHPGRFVFTLPVAHTLSASLLEEIVAEHAHGLDIRLFTADRYALMAGCDAALAASGTVTLELAILGIPAVVAYRLSAGSYWLGKMLIRHLEFFSLVNLIAGQAVLPELLQDEVTPERLDHELHALLFTPHKRQQVLEGLQEVRSALGPPGTADRAGNIALEVLGQNR